MAFPVQSYTENLSPSNDLFVVGGGILYFADSANTAIEYDLGCVDEFKISPEKDDLDVYCKRSGGKRLAKRIVRQPMLNISFNTKTISAIVLKWFLLGDSATESQTAGNVTAEDFTASANNWVKLSHRYLVGTPVVEDDGGGGSYTENTDYQIDYTSGRIRALTTGSMVNGTVYEIDFSYGSYSYTVLRPLNDTTLEGKLRFCGDPESGPHMEVVVWDVTLAPDGEIDFLTEEEATVGFTGVVNDDTTNHANSPYGKIYYFGNVA